MLVVFARACAQREIKRGCVKGNCQLAPFPPRTLTHTPIWAGRPMAKGLFGLYTRESDLIFHAPCKEKSSGSTVKEARCDTARESTHNSRVAAHITRARGWGQTHLPRRGLRAEMRGDLIRIAGWCLRLGGDVKVFEEIKNVLTRVHFTPVC